MSDQRPCIRCSRAIDAWARICPYCNQDQAAPVPAEEPVDPAVAAYVPPNQQKLRKRLMMGAGGIVMIFIMFAVGFAIINHKTKLAKEPKVQEEEAVAPPPSRPSTNVTLVPTSEAPTTTDGFEAPITSAPATNSAENVPTEYQRTDATAVASDEYAQMAARAKAERKKKMDALIDPRTLSGVAYNQGAPVPPPRPMTSAAPAPA
ncbi:MAG TPA: hypothetical protein VJ276_10985, partial [Thermoanaerobaculia bacterium]|nr:hypothetical protein [Thermoanaerobaculia bacterium]